MKASEQPEFDNQLGFTVNDSAPSVTIGLCPARAQAVSPVFLSNITVQTG
jgi:hypothetical protein